MNTLEATPPVTFAISEEEYNRMVNKKGSVLLEAEQQAHKKTALKLNTVVKHLSNFLDEFEAEFDNNKKCASEKIAMDYLDAAEYMRDNFGRKHNRIRDIEEWVYDQPLM